MNLIERRRNKLVESRIQWRFVRILLTTSALAVLVQALLLSYLLVRVADQLPHDGVVLKSSLLRILASSLLVTVFLLLPVTLSVGIASTHKIVGPLYRFRMYLTELLADAAIDPCRLRADDEFQDLRELLNLATERLRRAESNVRSETPWTPT